jgi:hypothetical protein
MKNFLPWGVIRTNNNGYLICGQSSAGDIGLVTFKQSKATLLNIDENGKEIWTSYHGGELGIQNAINISIKNEVWNVFGTTGSRDDLDLNFINYCLNPKGEIIN